MVGIDSSPAPQLMTIYHPVRPRMALSAQHLLHRCVLFAVNPFMPLLPLPDKIKEEHTQEVIPVTPMPNDAPPGVLLFGVGVNSDAGVTGSIEFSGPIQFQIVNPKAEEPKQSPPLVCPWKGNSP